MLRRITDRSSLTIHLSLITMRRDLARLIEPRAPTPDARIRAIARLRDAGIDVGINVMPVLPGITDNPTDLDDLVRQVAGAGATHVNACALRLRSTARARYLPFIAENFPHLAERYSRVVRDGHQLSQHYRDGLRQFFTSVCARVGIPFGSPGEDTETVSTPPQQRAAQTDLSRLIGVSGGCLGCLADGCCPSAALASRPCLRRQSATSFAPFRFSTASPIPHTTSSRAS